MSFKSSVYREVMRKGHHLHFTTTEWQSGYLLLRYLGARRKSSVGTGILRVCGTCPPSPLNHKPMFSFVFGREYGTQSRRSEESSAQSLIARRAQRGQLSWLKKHKYLKLCPLENVLWSSDRQTGKLRLSKRSDAPAHERRILICSLVRKNRDL